jgi:hypothetical protein
MEENIMALNVNEIILDRVRSLTAHSINDEDYGALLFRLTSLEDPSLNTTAEGEEVVDAIGALITTLYRAKKATFAASNSLISLDLAAAQYGSKKQVLGDKETITDYAYEILKVVAPAEGQTDYTVKLANKPNVDSIKYIYTIENNQIGTAYKAAAKASATEFVVADDGTITLPTSVTAGKVYVEYTYESASAMKVTNKASEFPTACSVVIYAYFKDVCNENKVYSGKIICPKAKLNPEQVELALTSTGKHAFEFQMMRDYCAEEGADELFSIIVSE